MPPPDPPAERSNDVVHFGSALRGVGQQHLQWRFVRDKRPYPAGVSRHEGEASDGPAATAKHVGGFGPKRV